MQKIQLPVNKQHSQIVSMHFFAAFEKNSLAAIRTGSSIEGIGSLASSG